MKRVILIALCLVTLTVFVSCGDDKVVIEEPVQASNTQDTLKQR